MTRLLPGPYGVDSPELTDDPPPIDTWVAWLHINDARATGRPALSHALMHALQLEAEPAWRCWWDRPHTAGVLTHRADVVAHPGGHTLLSCCGYSVPWAGNSAGVWLIGDRPIRDSRRTYCLHCTAGTGQQPHPEDRPPTDPGGLVALPA
jgi:hypothetical protein